MRLKLVRLGIRHGVKAIAYEKPMATSLMEARTICNECDQAGVKQIVCHQHKYGAHWRKVKEIVESGQIGDIRMLHATSKGWFFYYITHIGGLRSGGCKDTPRSNGSPDTCMGRGKLSDTHPSPDYMMGHVCFANDVRAMFECGPLSPTCGVDNFWYDGGVTVYGTEGFAEVIIGKGWRAITRDSGKIISDSSVSLNEIGDTIPYIADLARWLDDDSAIQSL